jgi:hypothetical protein
MRIKPGTALTPGPCGPPLRGGHPGGKAAPPPHGGPGQARARARAGQVRSPRPGLWGVCYTLASTLRYSRPSPVRGLQKPDLASCQWQAVLARDAPSRVPSPSLLLTPLVRRWLPETGLVPLTHCRSASLSAPSKGSQALRRLQVGGHTEAWHSNHTTSDGRQRNPMCSSLVLSARSCSQALSAGRAAGGAGSGSSAL